MVAPRSSLRACLVAGLPLFLQAFLLPHTGVVRPAVPTTRSSKLATPIYGAYCVLIEWLAPSFVWPPLLWSARPPPCTP